MFSIGKAKPDNRIAGIMKKKEVIIACCCVFDTIDISNPTAKVDIMKASDVANRSVRLPSNGTLK